MAITFRAASSPSLDFGTPRSNSVVNAPAGRVAGDRLFAGFGLINSTAPTLAATPDGWQSLGSAPWGPAQSAFGRLYIFTRIADGTAADNLTTVHPSMYSQGEMVAYPGVNSGTPLDVEIQFATGTTTAAGQNATAASATTLTDGAMGLVFRHGWDGSLVAPTSGWTERVDHAAGHVQERLFPTPGSTGAIVVPSGNTAGTKPWITATLILRDAAAADPGAYVPQWKAMVAAAVAGIGQARIMFVGDSFTEGEGPGARLDRWIDKVIAGLRAGAGIAGAGLGHTPPRYNTYVPDSLAWRSPATARNSGGVVTPIANKVFTRAAAESFQWSVNGDALTLYFNGAAGLGPISVSIDGGAAETIPAQTSGKAHRWDKTGLSAGAHTVRATAGTGGSQVVGVASFTAGDSPTTGLTYLDWSWTGSTSAQFAPGGPYDVTGIQFLPHLVIDGQHGANDHLNDIESAGATPAPAPSTVASRFGARVAQYRSWSSKPQVVLFVLPHMPAGSDVDEAQANSQGYTLDDYRDACIATAVSLDVPVIDCRELLTLTLADLASDNLHIKAAGHQVVADGITETLLDLSLPPRGGSSVTATAATTGGGRKVGRGGAAATATASTPGGGRKTTRGGAGATATASTPGAGRKVARGAAPATATATTQGAGWKVVRGGSTATATAAVEGGGHRVTAGSGGSVATAAAAVQGGGRKVARGGSTAVAVGAVQGSGTKRVAGGSSATATASVQGGGHRVDVAIPRGGSTATAAATVQGGGRKVARGGSTVTAAATVVGSGRNPDAAHDVTIVAVIERPTRTIAVAERPTRTITIREAAP